MNKRPPEARVRASREAAFFNAGGVQAVDYFLGFREKLLRKCILCGHGYDS